MTDKSILNRLREMNLEPTYEDLLRVIAAKDAEIARLRERVERAERKLAEVQRLHDGLWSCENAAHTARYFDEGLKRILRGEGE